MMKGNGRNTCKKSNRRPGSARKLSKKRKIVQALLCALAMIALFVCGLWLVDNKLPAFRQTASIYVRPETTYDEFTAQVMEKLQPRYPSSVRRTMLKEGVKYHMKPGHYCIDASKPAVFLARAVKLGWQTPVNLTLSGRIRSREALARKMSSQLMLDSAAIVNTLKDSVLLAQYGCRPSRLFEMVLPDTYAVYWNASMPELLQRFKKEHDAFWNEERVSAAKKQGLTPRQVSILASIVEEESTIAEEYPKIASVYLTRLRKGMNLQACPTVCYVYGYKLKRVLYQHTLNPSPYNTYRHAGLPPTPIALPGKEHIEAVLHPDVTPYLYFCASVDGSGRNLFAVTYKEHLQNARQYHKYMDSQTD